MFNIIFFFIGVLEDYEIFKKEELGLFCEVVWNFEKDELIVENGDFKIIEKNEVIKVWVYKCIKINKNEYEIYLNDYGIELIDLIG